MPRLRLLLLAPLLVACSTTEPPPEDPLDPALASISVSQPLLLPGDTVTITLLTRRASGFPVDSGGSTIVFATQGGTSSGSFLPVVDHDDGTYSVDFVAEAVGTPITVAASIDGEPVTSLLPSLRVVGFTRIAVSGHSQTSAQRITHGFSCGIITTGDMYCWGVSTNGIRGNATTGSMDAGLEPTKVRGGRQWTEVGAGSYFVCALAVGGALYCWGGNGGGQLANGTTGNGPDATTPTLAAGGGAYRHLSTSLIWGGCAITTTDEARCWGGGTWGRLGNGSEAAVGVPTPVTGGLSFDALSTYFSGSCGIAEGAAYCWGSDLLLGLGGAPPPELCTPSHCSTNPYAVSGGLTFRPIVANNGGVACAVAVDDKTYCWGGGPLGNGTLESSGSPTPVTGDHAFTFLTAGDDHLCGIAMAGAAYCWGDNRDGKLGNGTLAYALVPTPVSGGHTFTWLAAAQDHTCGITTDGLAYCWGGNDKGELGDRSVVSSPVPVRVRLFAP